MSKTNPDIVRRLNLIAEGLADCGLDRIILACHDAAQEIEGLRASVKQYGYHTEGCSILKIPGCGDDGCDCGYNETIKAIAKAEGK